MNIKIEPVQKNDYQKIMDIWESSVRATHHFLKEEDLLFYKPLILNEYLDAVTLLGAKFKGEELVGFMGISNANLEMLFIHPDFHRKGIGQELVKYALTNFKARKVDVNEQNEQALAFYLKLGFEIMERSELDGMGKPYPLLHLEWKGLK